MNEISGIVAATDFSVTAEWAARRAATLAKHWHCPVTLVNVFDDGVLATVKAVYDIGKWASFNHLDADRTRLQALAEKIKADAGFDVATEMLRGAAPSALAEFAAAQKPRLLVLGEHGEGWLSAAVLGSTAMKVLHAIRAAPVLVVRRDPLEPYHEVLVATDFSAASARAARLALTLPPATRLTLVSAYGVALEGRMRLAGATQEDLEAYRERERSHADQNMKRFVDDLGEGGQRFVQRLVHGHAAAAILRSASELSADLIVIGKHGGSATEERLLGSVTQNILHQAEGDVLMSA